MDCHPRTHWPAGRPTRFRRRLVASLLCSLALGLVSAGVAPAQQPAEKDAAEAQTPLEQPTARDEVVARLIARLMPQNHISGKDLDDKIARRAMHLFLDSLDPMKLYFYQSDVEEFSQQATEIDDMIRNGDLSLAYTIFQRFNRRVDQHVAIALELLDGEFDFQRDETITIDPEAAEYARNAEDARDRWRRQIKFALLDLKDDGTEGEEAVDQLRRRYGRYARRWAGTDKDDLLEMYLSAVTMGYDPHSTYMSPGTLDDFQITMRLNLEGIGAALREKDGNTVVSSVIPGGAAAKHGKLKPDDVIIGVGQGEDGEVIDIVEMPLKEVVDKIRGKAGTLVRLRVKPGGVGNAETYEIVRAKVELEESAARGEIIEHELPGSSKTLKLGYINLPSFYLDMESAKQHKENYRSSTRDVRRILENFRSEGVAGVVLDLSKNGGGSLTEAISLTGLFVDEGPVVQVKNSDGSVQQYADEEEGTAWDGPLVVMTSKFSASASEILAGAIRDYGRGIVVGDPATHGKGTVQTLMDLGQTLFRNNRENFGALKVTLQQFYLPGGESTQRKGVPADVVLPSITAEMDISESDLDYALQHDRVSPARHDLYGMVPSDLLTRLRKNSAQRVENNPEFTDLLRRVELYVEQNERHRVSLNEEAFMKRRAELDAREEEKEKELEQQLSRQEVYGDTYYNREVLNIAHEYVEGLREQNLATLH